MSDQSKLASKIYTDNNGFYSYEIFNLSSDSIFKIAELIEKEYKAKFEMPVLGLSQILIDFVIDNQPFILGWDNWSGLFISARSELSNNEIFNLGKYLDTKISTLGW